MYMLLRGLLVAIIFVSTGVCPPVAVAQEQGDDGTKPTEALAATAAEETEPPIARYLANRVIIFVFGWLSRPYRVTVTP
jgi:hypothetical protein